VEEQRLLIQAKQKDDILITFLLSCHFFVAGTEELMM